MSLRGWIRGASGEPATEDDLRRSLAETRKTIERIDREIFSLVELRGSAVLRAWDLKEGLDEPEKSPGRESYLRATAAIRALNAGADSETGSALESAILAYSQSMARRIRRDRAARAAERGEDVPAVPIEGRAEKIAGDAGSRGEDTV